MKVFIFGIIIGCVTGLTSFYLLVDKGSDTKQSLVEEIPVVSSETAKSLENLASSHKQQLDELKSGQQELAYTLALLNNKLQTMSGEMDSLKESTSESLDNDLENKASTIGQNSSTAEPDGVSEDHLSRYVDEVIENDGWDENTTATAWEQTDKVLENMPGVMLDDMQCSTNICRAKFARVDGMSPDISNIWGNPPFVSEGFTIPQKDGSIVLYFTEQGSSVEDFRQLAQGE